MVCSRYGIRGVPAQAVAAATILLTAGCTGSAIVGNAYYDSSYNPLEYRVQGVLPVVVHGDPFPIPQSEFDQIVADALEGTTFGTTTRFAPASDDSTAPYRVAMDFDGSESGDGLCPRREVPRSAPGPAPPGARVNVSAALCRGDRAIAYANGSIATEGGPQGPEFRNGIARFGMTLFPPTNPQNVSPGAEFQS